MDEISIFTTHFSSALSQPSRIRPVTYAKWYGVGYSTVIFEKHVCNRYVKNLNKFMIIYN